MAPESNKNDQLQSVSEAEKNNLHNNHNHENVITIESTLNTTYEPKSIGGIDAKHDAKVIALKYFSGSYKGNVLTTGLDKKDIVIDAFVTVRNELGKDFFDNLLYKYDVPYCQIEALATELRLVNNDKTNALRKNQAEMQKRLSTNGKPISSQVTESKTPEASSSNQNNESEKLHSASNVKVYETLSNIIGFNVLKCSAPERAEADKRFELKPLQSFDKKTVEGMIKQLNDEQKTIMNKEIEYSITFLNNCLSKDAQIIKQEIGVDHTQIQQILSKLQQVKESMNSEKNTPESSSSNQNDKEKSSSNQQANNKYELTTTKDVNKIKEYTDFFDNIQKNMDGFLKKELLAQDLQLSNEIQQKLSQGITNWRADKTSTKYKEELAAKGVDKVSKIFLAKMMTSSPFDPENRKKYGITQDFNKMVKDIVSNQTDVKDFTVDQFYQLLTDLNTPQKKESVKDENEKTKTTESESDSKTKPEQVKTVKDFISAIKDNKENEATKSLKKPLQTFINLYESGRSPTQSEAMMMSAMPIFEQGAAAIGALGDGINQLFDGLKESGVWDEIAKIMELLFGTGSFEDRLKRFNEIKETEMTLDQSWAMNKGFEEWKKVQDKTTLTQSLDQYAITLKKDMPDKLFGKDQKWKIAMDPDGKNQEYQGFMKKFKEQTQWTGTEEPTFNNLIVWAHGTPEQRENILTSPTTECSIDDIKSVLSSKVDGIYKRSNDEDREKSNNPNESFSRALLASLITPPNDSLRVARGVMKADKETTTSLEAQKTAEINMFKESLQLEKTATGYVKITPEQGRKVQVDGQDVPYDKTIGIQIPAGKSFSVISTSEKHKTSYGENAIKVENITLLTPIIDTKETKTDGKIKLSGLDTKKAYTGKITYEDKSESPNQTIGEGQVSEFSVDKEKTPSYLILKQDDNGIKQRIAFQKKVETVVKK